MLPVNLYRFLYLFKRPFLAYLCIMCYHKCIKRINTLNTQITEKGASYVILGLSDRRPIYEQIVEKFRMLILSGAVEPSSKMPSVRQLAVELSINPNTIQRAYMELEQQGLICPVKGKGSFVTDSSRIRQIGMEETLSELKKITEKGMALGVGEEEMIGVIRLCYKEGNND